MPGLIAPIYYPREYVSTPTKDDIVRTFKKWTTIRWMFCHKHGVISGLVLSDSGQATCPNCGILLEELPEGSIGIWEEERG